MDFMSANLSLILTISGLFVAAIGTIVEKLAPEDRRGARSALVILAIVGFAVTAWGAIMQQSEDDKQKQGIGALVTAAQSPLTQDLDARLDRIDADLRAANSAGNKLYRAPVPVQSAPAAPQYFVQIASDTSADRLQAFAARMQKTYNVTSEVAGVVDMGSVTNRYRLTFGQHLDKATAEKYVAIANRLGLPPPNQSASIQLQPK